jgi:hypothetical protein
MPLYAKTKNPLLGFTTHARSCQLVETKQSGCEGAETGLCFSFDGVPLNFERKIFQLQIHLSIKRLVYCSIEFVGYLDFVSGFT